MLDKKKKKNALGILQITVNKEKKRYLINKTERQYRSPGIHRHPLCLSTLHTIHFLQYHHYLLTTPLTHLHGSSLVSARVDLLGVTVLKSVHLILGSLSLLDRCRWVSLGESLQGLGVGSDGVSDSTGVDVESLHVDVLERVTLLMVVWIVPLSSLSTEHLGFSLSLDTLSTSEETSGSNSDVKEWAVIRAAGELSWDGLLANGLVILLEEILNLVGTGWASEVEAGSITIVDTEHVVRGGDHVEVEVEADLVLLSLWKVGNVVFGTDETELLWTKLLANYLW
jgi:hypothetical protein